MVTDQGDKENFKFDLTAIS